MHGVKPFRTDYAKNPKLTAAECRAAAEALDYLTREGARYTVTLRPAERRALERAKQKLTQAYLERSGR